MPNIFPEGYLDDDGVAKPICEENNVEIVEAVDEYGKGANFKKAKLNYEQYKQKLALKHFGNQMNQQQSKQEKNDE